MNKQLRFLLLMILPLSVLVVSCGEDDNGGGPAPAPSITSISPDEAFPGDQVTITGENLADVSRVSVGVDQVSYDATATTIDFTVPEDAQPGEVTITIVNPGGNATTTLEVLRPAGPPSVSAVNRHHVSGGDELVILGENFVDVEAVLIGETEIEVEGIELVETTDTLRFVVPEGATGGAITVTTRHGNVVSQEEVAVHANTILVADFDGNGIRPEWNAAGAIEEMEITSGPAPVAPFFGDYMYFYTPDPATVQDRGFAMVQPNAPEGGHQPYPFTSTDPANVTLSFWVNAGSNTTTTLQIIISTNDANNPIYASYHDVESGWNNVTINLADFGYGYGASEIEPGQELALENVIAVDFRYFKFKESVQAASVDNVMFLED